MMSWEIKNQEINEKDSAVWALNEADEKAEECEGHEENEGHEKNEKYGRRILIRMGELKEGSLWRHLENVSGQELSRRERMSMQRERDGIRYFMRNWRL